MSVLAVGVSHRTAPVALLGRVALSAEAVAKLLSDVVHAESVAEAAVLSTCNRVEVYAEVARFHPAVAEVSELLARHSGVGLDELTPHLYVHFEDRAVAHLFAVTCGLDSMVVGESQILGQVRTALREAQRAGTAGRVLNELVQQALRVGKLARSQTGLDRAGRSLVSVGLDLAAATLGDLPGRRGLVVGAGAMSSLAATGLAAAGLDVVVTNRTPAAGRRLAASVSGRFRPLPELSDAVADSDVVVSCTGAVGTVLPAEVVGDRRTRPLFLLDLALPHDVDPAVRELPGVTLVDLERLAEQLAGGPVAADVDEVRGIVAEETEAFVAWQRASAVAPTVVALRARAEGYVEAELARLASRLPELDLRTREEVALAVRRVVEKLLHAPSVRVKELAGSPGGQLYAAALRELFDLDPRAVSAVTVPEAVPPERPS